MKTEQVITKDSNEGDMFSVIDQCINALTKAVEGINQHEVSEHPSSLIETTSSIIASIIQSRVDSPILTNQKTLAEADKEFALARKVNAEAEAIELQNIEKKIELIEKAISTSNLIKKLKCNVVKQIGVVEN